MLVPETISYEDEVDLQDFTIGKDVLEVLSTSMYVNPLSVYREYIQNSTDAIDDAVEIGLLQNVDSGFINIMLDNKKRSVIIRDNGKGLSNNEFFMRMRSIGSSEKRGSNARGFRGIGRLAGLGYSQKLTFRSRADGDAEVLEATWDGSLVKQILLSNDRKIDLTEFVRSVVSFKKLDPEGYPPHFFEVELIKPRRIGNDKILNKVEVESYISQVCPCPFDPNFSFGKEISEILAQHGNARKSYLIHINAKKEPVYRPYRNQVEYSNTTTSVLRRLDTFKIKCMDEGIAAIGWVAHHDYLGAIPSLLGVRGLRARVGNIQVGNDRLLIDVFPEDRFCSWAIGEIHVLDSRVIPNGRRDDFESNLHLDNIISHLRPVGTEVAKLCRLSSQRRNRLKTIKNLIEKINEKLDVLKQGAVSDDYANSIKEEIINLKLKLKQIMEYHLFEDRDRVGLEEQISSIEKAVDIQMGKKKEDYFNALPKVKRSAYEEVFDLIYDCSSNKIAAKNLVDRILIHLKSSKR